MTHMQPLVVSASSRVTQAETSDGPFHPAGLAIWKYASSWHAARVAVVVGCD